eukprot:8582377-Pyramimonas_sp.AAC.1
MGPEGRFQSKVMASAFAMLSVSLTAWSYVGRLFLFIPALFVMLYLWWVPRERDAKSADAQQDERVNANRKVSSRKPEA